MSSKRPIVLMGILLLSLGYLYYEYNLQYHPAVRSWIARMNALPGENTVSEPQLKQLPDGNWEVSFEYFYTGAPANAHPKLLYRSSAGQAYPLYFPKSPVQQGKQRVSAVLSRPGAPGTVQASELTAVLAAYGVEAPLASARSSQVITWPDAETFYLDQTLAKRSPEENVRHAATLIDKAQMREAQRILDRLLQKDSKLAPAYLELARIAMKRNWGPEGLQQAEALIGSSLQLQPGNANANILLAYVYTYQQRFKESEPLLVAAAKEEPRNLWLWTNWGEFHQLQGQDELAMEKYREAIRRPPTGDTYDNARIHAYEKLIGLLEARKDIDGMEALHRQRNEEYPAEHCHTAKHAQFLLRHRGDLAGAQAVLAKLTQADCREGMAREVLGMIHYVNWGRSEGDAAAEALRQARLLVPSGPWTVYQLAKSEHTEVAVRKLVATGQRIDVQDNEQFDALAYAMRERDHAAARRLLRLGAKPTALIGAGQLPIALMPVLLRDLEGIRMMRGAGVDYGKLQYQGTTALDHARTQNDQELLRALDPKSRASSLGA